MRKQPVINIALRKASRATLEEIAAEFIDQVEEGELDPLDTFVFSYKLLELAKMLNEGLKPQVKGLKGEFYGLRISEAKTGSTFDYSNCGSHKLPYLIEELERFKQLITQEQAMLKSLPHPLEVVDTDTGETYQLRPPVNTYGISPKIEWL